MYPTRLLRSSAFRLALGYGTLFFLSALFLLAFVYWTTSSYMERQAAATIEAEIQGLAERYRLTGLPGLTASIRERLERRPQGSSIYLLTDARFDPIVGNLNRWPPEARQPDDEGFVELELAWVGDEVPHRARAKTFVLRGGFNLLVGRDMHELREIRSLLLVTMGWGAVLTLGLAIAGGLLASRSRIRRIATINEAIGAVVAGDLTRRIPEEPTGDDIEELVERLNRMLDELEKLVEGVRRVSDAVAHDLRTPLAKLKTRLERLRSGGAGGDEVEAAVEEADRLLATFAALLRIARIEAGESGRGAFGDVDLTELIDDVAELYAPLVEDAGKRLVLHNAPRVRVEGDRDMLFQAVVNVVDNALKHTPPGGRIEIALAPTPSGGAEIAVADDGPGIPEEEREQVRERFYRLDRSRSTPGAGLGLSLVAAVVERHQGTLRFDDAAPGLRVTIGLPGHLKGGADRTTLF